MADPSDDKHPVPTSPADAALELGSPIDTLLDTHMHDSATRLRLLYEMIAQSSLSFEALIHDVLARTTRLLGLRVGLLSRIEDETYTIEAGYAPRTSLQNGQTFRLSDTPCSLTLAGTKPLAINHFSESDHNGHPCRDVFDLESYIGIPVRVSNAIYGTLNFSGPEPKAPPFSSSDRELIALLGQWVGNTLERKQAQDQLERSEQLLARVLQGSLDGIVVLEAVRDARSEVVDFVFLVVNPAAAEIYGRRAEDLIGTRYLDLVPGTQEAGVADALIDVVTTGRPYRDETFYEADGISGWFDYTVVQLGDGVALTFRDVTERHEAEQALRESEERFAKAFLAAPVAMGIVTLYEGRFVDINDSFCALTGYARDELIGHTNEELNLTPTFDELQETARRVQDEGSLRDIAFQIRSKSGVMREVTVSAELIEFGGVPCLLGIGFDATERGRLEREVIEAAEFERRRIGQDLHDELGQQLTGAAFLGQVLSQKLAAKELPEAEDAEHLTSLINDVLAEARDFSRLLSPVDVRAEGLVDALQDLTDQTERVFGLSCPFLTNGDVRVADNAAATHLFRIAQEALNNAVKHADPSTVTVCLTRDMSTLRLVVEDDGTGIDLPTAQQTSSLGLRAMRYRATLIGATLRIAPRDTGTVLSVSLPVRSEAQEPSEPEA